MLRIFMLLMSMVLSLTASANTYYVNGSTGADRNSGTSSLSAKKTIQAAVNSASSGDTILVSAGSYKENLVLAGKALHLKSIGALDVTIDGNQTGSCIAIDNACDGTVIDGFNLYNGAPTNTGNKYGGGICCRSSATIRNCVFKNNGNPAQHFSGGLEVAADKVTVYNCLFVGNKCFACGGAVLCEGNGTFDRCTFFDNICTRYKAIGGIGNAIGGIGVAGGTATVKNSILWGNWDGQIGRFNFNSTGSYSVSYSCIQGGMSGEGNIKMDPCFADTESFWALSPTSPCINAGDPTSLNADGSRADMGFSLALVHRNALESGGAGNRVLDDKRLALLRSDQLSATVSDNTNHPPVAAALASGKVAASGACRIEWDLNAHRMKLKSDVEFEVTGAKSRPALYCVIDLSAGMSASSYPVTYLDAIPSGGWTDEYKTTRLVMRYIEAGAYKMQNTCYVTLTKPFYCGVFEVTQRQYELVTGSNPSAYKGDMRPVEMVSWNMIRGDSTAYNWPSSASIDPCSFVGRLQARTGLNFDLPTEAQWEFACRAGTDGDYNNGGDAEVDLGQHGRYLSNQSDGKGGCTVAHTNVGSYQPNAWGLYDMHGNVCERCLDWFGPLPYGEDPKGPPLGSLRVSRGGSWRNAASRCTSFSQYNSKPSSKVDICGFRLVRTLSN